MLLQLLQLGGPDCGLASGLAARSAPRRPLERASKATSLCGRRAAPHSPGSHTAVADTRTGKMKELTSTLYYGNSNGVPLTKSTATSC